MNIAIIVAAGQGTRMGGKVPKQFRELGGVPVIVHTLRRFEQSQTIGEVIVVVPADARNEILHYSAQYNLRKVRRVVPGGDTRADSVWRGLESVRGATAEVIAVHDGARPFVTPGEIDAAVNLASETGAAILTTPATDTMKEVAGDVIVRTLPRVNVRRALTPQCFRYELLMRAYREARAQADVWLQATDDSLLVEQIGAPVHVIDSDPRNIKLTHPDDWALAEKMMKEEVRG